MCPHYPAHSTLPVTPSLVNRSPPTIEDIATELHHLQSYVTETSDDESAEGSESDASVPKSSVGEQAMIWREEKGKSVYVPKFYLPRGNNKSFRKDYTMAEVAKHNTLEDCWVVIESHVYDITKFVPNHPGGWLNLQNMAGKDSTDAFANYHQASVYRTLLPAYYIGDVVDSLDDDPFTIEHRRIRQDLLRRGLFETNLYFYYIKVLWLAALLFSAVSLTLYGTTSVRRMSGAVVMVSDWTHAIRSNAHVFLIHYLSPSIRRFSGSSWLLLGMTLVTTLSHTLRGSIHFLGSFLVTPWAGSDWDGGNTLTTCTMLCATASSMTLISSTCHSSP